MLGHAAAGAVELGEREGGIADARLPASAYQRAAES
jgi:hypothetical protein